MFLRTDRHSEPPKGNEIVGLGTVPGVVANGRAAERAPHKAARSLPLPVPYRRAPDMPFVNAFQITEFVDEEGGQAPDCPVKCNEMIATGAVNFERRKQRLRVLPLRPLCASTLRARRTE